MNPKIMAQDLENTKITARDMNKLCIKLDADNEYFSFLEVTFEGMKGSSDTEYYVAGKISGPFYCYCRIMLVEGITARNVQQYILSQFQDYLRLPGNENEINRVLSEHALCSKEKDNITFLNPDSLNDKRNAMHRHLIFPMRKKNDINIDLIKKKEKKLRRRLKKCRLNVRNQRGDIKNLNHRNVLTEEKMKVVENENAQMRISIQDLEQQVEVLKNSVSSKEVELVNENTKTNALLQQVEMLKNGMTSKEMECVNKTMKTNTLLQKSEQQVEMLKNIIVSKDGMLEKINANANQNLDRLMKELQQKKVTEAEHLKEIMQLHAACATLPVIHAQNASLQKQIASLNDQLEHEKKKNIDAENSWKMSLGGWTYNEE